MMDKRIDMIPLRDAWNGSRKRRVNKAVKVVKGYVSRHAKSKIIKISKALNEVLWADASMNPPRKVKVQILTDKENDVSWVEGCCPYNWAEDSSNNKIDTSGWVVCS